MQRLPLLRLIGAGSAEHDEHLKPGEMPTMNGPLAARLLCDIAQHWKSGGRALPILDLEKRHGLPESFVRRVMKYFIDAGIVAETENGYLLSRPPKTCGSTRSCVCSRASRRCVTAKRSRRPRPRAHRSEGSMRSQLHEVTLAQLL